MPIDIVCSCGKRLRAADDARGKKIRCPGCKAVLIAEESATPAPARPAATTKAPGAAPRPAKLPASRPAAADAPTAKKSSAKIFWIIGCGCLGLMGSGVAAVVITVIVVVASHKSFKDQIIGDWVLDKEFSKRKNMDLKPAWSDLRCKFEKGGLHTIHCEGTDAKWKWEVLAETKSSTGTPKLDMILTNEAGNLPMPTTIYYWDDDHIEITFPMNCILRRATAADGSASSANSEKRPKLGA
jgi:hypothetical protein